MDRALVLLVLAGCRLHFADSSDGGGDSNVVIDDSGNVVSCSADTDCGRCQRCENSRCERATFGEVGLGGSNGCALDELGQVWCWGLNAYLVVASELSGLDSVFRPRRRIDITETIDRIAVGWGLLYLRTTSHTLISRGTQDGNVNDPGTGWARVFASHFNGCATTTSGGMYCSGLDDNGQRGTGTTASSAQPLAQFGADFDWDTVSPGDATCAIKQNGTLWCVGANSWGQLGRGTTTQFESSIVQVGTDTDWAAVDVADLHVCAIKQNGTLWCWGYGIVSAAAITTPVQVGGAGGWSNLDSYNRCSSAVRGGVGYWTCYDGMELASSLTGTTSFDWTPLPFTPDTNTRVVLGTQAGCYRANGAWMCWGDNRGGAVGVEDAVVTGPTPLCE